MNLAHYRRSIILSLLAVPLGILAERNFRNLPRLAYQVSQLQLPSLSIIIPARNEMHNLHRILPSLKAIQYPGKLEILVVDDHSSDRTAQVAASYGVQVLKLVQEPPSGWNGKPHACHQGALQATSEWLLFTDADTVHSSDGIPAAIEYAEENQLDGLSLFLRQRSTRWLDRLALDTAFAGLFASWHASERLLNGQFILVRRQVYFESGGFGSVRDELLEDVAFGNLVSKQSYQFKILNGDQIAAVNMYPSKQRMFQGLSRLGAGMLGWQGTWSAITALYVTALVSPLVIILGVISRKLSWFWLPITWASATFSLLPWSRRSGSGWSALLAPFGAVIILISALWGFINRLSGRGLPWKDRLV
jgi:chlorobactene glucosyltransferase